MTNDDLRRWPSLVRDAVDRLDRVNVGLPAVAHRAVGAGAMLQRHLGPARPIQAARADLLALAAAVTEQADFLADTANMLLNDVHLARTAAALLHQAAVLRAEERKQNTEEEHSG